MILECLFAMRKQPLFKQSFATRTFLVGNPFMSHVDVAAFLAANSDKIIEVKKL